MKKFIIFISIILMASQSLLSQWVWQNPLPHGNGYNTIKFINRNTGFAGGDYGQFYKSTNGGINWNKQNFGSLANINSIFFIDVNTGWMCADSSILRKTTDGGLTWVDKNPGIQGSYRAVFFANDSTGFLNINGSSSIIAKTTNYGATWNSVYNKNAINLSGLYFKSQNTGFALYDDMHYWPNSNNYSETIYFIKTTDGGINWTDNNFITSYSLYHTYDYKRSRDILFMNDTTGFVTSDFLDLFLTTNSGLNWIKQTQLITSIVLINERLGYSGGDKKYKTTNGGLNWFVQDAGFTGYARTGSFPDSLYGWFTGTGGGIIRTTNGGGNYQEQNYGAKNNLLGLSFINNTTGYACGEGGTILKTINAGTNWISMQSGNIGSKKLYTIKFINENTGWIGCDSAIFRTTNGGLFWSRNNIQVSYPQDCVNKIEFLNTGIGFAVVNYGGVIYKSTDYGQNWTLNHTVLKPKGINVTKDGMWYIVINYPYFQVSTDNGQTWINKNCPNNGGALCVFFLNSQTGWLNSLEFWYPALYILKLYKTTNGGINWIQLNNGFSVDKMYFQTTTEGITVNGSNMQKTTNGGNNWFSIYNYGNIINDLNSVDKNVYIAGENGMIMKGTDIFSISSINEQTAFLPEKYALLQNYPNPFNPTTKIKFDVPSLSFPNVSIGNPVVLKVYDITGREIQTLVNEKLQPGTYETTFDGSGLTSGVYFYKMITDGYSETKKMIYLK